MSEFPYRLTSPIGSKGALGLVVLQADETIEQEFRQIIADPEIAVYVTRVPSCAEVTAESLGQMERDLPGAVELLPQPTEFDAVGYGCTSGTTLIGANRVAALVKDRCRTKFVTNPLSASFAAFRHLAVDSIALVSPYIAPVADSVSREFEAAGIRVVKSLTFGERVEANVARIDSASIRAAALEVGKAEGADAVFLSCTNLRTLGVIDELEATLGVPVVSSNLALCWHMACTIGCERTATAPGRLFRS